jgi:protein SCO1/2
MRSAPARSMTRHILGVMRTLAIALVITLLACVACAQPKLAGTELNAIDAPDFALTDGVSGRALQLASLRGQVVALTFLYTSCPDVCPLTAAMFKAAQDGLGQDAASVSFVAVSVDPERDTPQAVQAFSKAHALERNWYYLVGARAQLATVWAAYGIGVQDDSARVTHNDAVYLIDKRGRERVLMHSDALATDLLPNLRTLARAG